MYRHISQTPTFSEAQASAIGTPGWEMALHGAIGYKQAQILTRFSVDLCQSVSFWRRFSTYITSALFIEMW